MATSFRSLLMLFCCATAALGGRLHAILDTDYSSESPQQTILSAEIDPGTGEVQHQTVDLPSTGCPGGKWRLSNGTNGQGWSSFYMNGSLFFVARQVCGREEGNTTLFQMYGLATSLHPLATLPQIDGCPLEALHVSWDWACNVLVMAPARNGSLISLEVSEYDGQVRTLPSLNRNPGWDWVPGLGAVDNGHYNDTTHGSEWSCGGAGCALYLKEKSDWDSDLGPAIVGRLIHTGEVVSNSSGDPTRLRTLSYLPANAWTNIDPAARVLEHFSEPALALYHTNANPKLGDVFFGIGVCCELEQCPSECEGHGGELSLVVWEDRTIWPRVVATLGNSSRGAASESIELGVAVDIFGYPVEPGQYATRVSVWAGESILSFKVTEVEGEVSLEKIGEATPALSGERPRIWSYLMM